MTLDGRSLEPYAHFVIRQGEDMDEATIIWAQEADCDWLYLEMKELVGQCDPFSLWVLERSLGDAHDKVVDLMRISLVRGLVEVALGTR